MRRRAAPGGGRGVWTGAPPSCCWPPSAQVGVAVTLSGHTSLSTAAANSVLGLGLLSGQQATHCQLVWAHLQLVLVLGLTRDQGRSLTARLCRWTRF